MTPTEPINDYEDREYGTLEKDLTSVVSQVQKLVDQYHELTKDVGHLSDKIPPELDKRLVTIEIQLDRIVKDIETQYVTQREFETYKLEHNQMKHLMWGFLIMIMTSVVGAWLALIVHNASSVIK